MKAFKWMDLIGQLIVSVFLLIFYPMIMKYDSNGFFWWLFILGGWQVVSTLIHRFAFRYAFRNNGRTTYNIILLLILPIGWMMPFAMLVIGPCMACWYFITCVAECVRISAERPAAFYK